MCSRGGKEASIGKLNSFFIVFGGEITANLEHMRGFHKARGWIKTAFQLYFVSY